MHRSAADTPLRGARDVRIGVASFLRHWEPDAVTWTQADPVVEIADQILENGDPQFMSVGDGIVTFHCANGDVSYGLREHDDVFETWIGVRSDIALDDLLS